MRSKNIFLFAAVILIAAMFTGCSSESVTGPSLDLERALDGPGNGGPGNGGHGGPGGGGPGGDHGLWGDFDVDCSTLFGVDYVITMPNGNVKTPPGRVKIFDNDCDANESDVLVRFMFFLGDNGKHGPKRVLPGTKTTLDTGAIKYAGESGKAKEWDNHGFEFSLSYELIVTEEVIGDGIVLVIDGWMERSMYKWWLKDDGIVEKEWTWEFDVSGEEIVTDED